MNEQETELKRLEEIERELQLYLIANDLQTQIGEWGVSTFGTALTTEGIENHLKKELLELLTAPNFESKIEEASDMLILLLHYAYRQGYDALGEARRKFEIIKRRKWEGPDSEGCFSHVKNLYK